MQGAMESVQAGWLSSLGKGGAAAGNMLPASAAVALLVVAVTIHIWWRRLRYDLHKIPLAPNAVPILGHLPLYWRHADFTRWFLKMHEESKQPILRVEIAHKSVIITADPAIAARVYARTGPDNIPRKVPEYGVFDAATGLYGHHSILTEQREDMWVAVRKALSPAYTLAANKQNYLAVLKAYGDVGRRINAALAPAAMASPKQQQLEASRSKPGSSAAAAAAAPCIRVVDADILSISSRDQSSERSSDSFDSLWQEAVAAAAAAQGADDDDLAAGAAAAKDAVVVAAAGAGAEGVAADVQVDHHLLGAAIQMQVEGLFEMQENDIDYLQVAHDIELAISIVHHHSVQPWLKPLHFLTPWASATGRQLRDARLRLSRQCYERIYHHVLNCEKPSDLSLTACLRKLVDPATGKAPCRERLLAEIGNQIMAPETAAHTVSWVLYCLATHPEAEAKVVAELREAGLPCDGDLEAAVEVLARSFDPLKGLPYLECVINEAMRLYPAGSSASPRLTEKPTRVGGYLLPAGTVVFPCLFTINNYSGHWGPDAQQFKPERWMEQNAGVDPASGAPRFLPFSSGPKNCIGLALGQVAVRSAVGLLMSSFRFSPAERMGTHEDVLARSMLALTLKVEGGMWLRATRRTAA